MTLVPLFFSKNSSSKNTFGSAPLGELEQELAEPFCLSYKPYFFYQVAIFFLTINQQIIFLIIIF
jgi:hypothetical protein